jgi:hypothetical protein
VAVGGPPAPRERARGVCVLDRDERQREQEGSEDERAWHDQDGEPDRNERGNDERAREPVYEPRRDSVGQVVALDDPPPGCEHPDRDEADVACENADEREPDRWERFEREGDRVAGPREHRVGRDSVDGTGEECGEGLDRGKREEEEQRRAGRQPPERLAEDRGDIERHTPSHSSADTVPCGFVGTHHTDTTSLSSTTGERPWDRQITVEVYARRDTRSPMLPFPDPSQHADFDRKGCYEH